MNSLLTNIGPFDYIKPLQLLSEYYGSSSYYYKCYEKFKSHENIKLIEDNTYGKYTDFIVNTYIKCMKNVFVLTLWKPFIQNNDLRICADQEDPK
jgi:hypothetical protein